MPLADAPEANIFPATRHQAELLKRRKPNLQHGELRNLLRDEGTRLGRTAGTTRRGGRGRRRGCAEVQDIDGLLRNQLSDVPDDDLLAELLVCAHGHQEAAVGAEGSQLQQTCSGCVVVRRRAIVKFA